MMEWIEANRKLPEGFSGKERVVVGFFIQPNGKVVDGVPDRYLKTSDETVATVDVEDNVFCG